MIADLRRMAASRQSWTYGCARSQGICFFCPVTGQLSSDIHHEAVSFKYERSPSNSSVICSAFNGSEK